MPRMAGGTTSVIITGMATRPPTMKATATPCTGMRNQSGTSRKVGRRSSAPTPWHTPARSIGAPS